MSHYFQDHIFENFISAYIIIWSIFVFFVFFYSIMGAWMHEDFTEEDSIGSWWEVSIFHDEISLSFKQTPPETDKTQQGVLNILGIHSSRPTQEDVPYHKLLI